MVQEIRVVLRQAVVMIQIIMVYVDFRMDEIRDLILVHLYVDDVRLLVRATMMHEQRTIMDDAFSLPVEPGVQEILLYSHT